MSLLQLLLMKDHTVPRAADIHFEITFCTEPLLVALTGQLEPAGRGSQVTS